MPASDSLVLCELRDLSLAQAHLANQVADELGIEDFSRRILCHWLRSWRQDAIFDAAPEVLFTYCQLIPQDRGNEAWVVDLPGSVGNPGREHVAVCERQVIAVVITGFAGSPGGALSLPALGFNELPVRRMR